ncbi:Clp protease N-terminal domain-containing protein [Kitasatospora sp. NPDC085879]|uniref:Clp protease N-terminal domain-containing protein n=1 Tax=Kitasatospora sp. NPDC085879 TaxID=3154769 RepID=UPI000BB0F6AA|nr:Clp protease N-terminal domain-containing protein [Streptomyces sp. TLI_235]PBC77480.1 ClpA/ClpB-like protein [Streptomyces sp. TLI_235]
MFERFTDGARRVVIQAQVEARELGHERVGTEHLLLGIVHDPDDPVAALLAADGLDHEAARAEVVRLAGGEVDGRALAAIGVDLDAVRAAVESAFGEGALERRPAEGKRDRKHSRLTPGARKTLELSLRETLRLKQKEIATGHILLGLIREGQGTGAEVLSGRGLDFAKLRRDVEAILG